MGDTLKPVKEGKVREIYDNGDSLIMVATDRISCYDVILKNIIEKKGTVLTQMSKFWFEMTEDILPNHMITTDVNEMPEFFRKPEYTGNSMMCKKLTMLPVECIVRGYITGSGWASYSRFTHHLQRLRSVIMMRTFLLRSQSKYLRRNSLVRVRSMLRNFVTIQSLFIRNVLIMLLQRVSSLQILSLSSVLMRTEI